MPIPKPNKGERKDKFMARCMASPTMMNEYDNIAQRYAICNSQWNHKKKGKK